MRRIATALLAVLTVSAADLPLGIVESVDQGGEVAVRFDAAARIAPGLVLTLYSSGGITKHPLTGEVLVEQRRPVAKVQVVAVDGPRQRCRVLWKESDPQAGMDAVPLPGDVAPNAPPAATAAPAAATVAPGALAALKLPLADPDGDPLVVRWQVVGPVGASGRLDAATTTGTDNLLLAPGLAGPLTVKAVATDPLGQSCTIELPITVEGPAPRRQPALAGRWGVDAEPMPARLLRAEDGSWIGLGEDGSAMHRISSGWLAMQAMAATAPDQAWKRAVAVAVRGREVFVLDASRSCVHVYEGRDGLNFKRRFGTLSRPTDLVVASDGTVYVADQSAGGILVFESNGRPRCRLGAIEGDEAFTGLARLALAADGTLHALDAQARQIHRFDRNHRRLDTWTVTGDPAVPALDIAVHPRGLAVLLASGVVQFYGPKGAPVGEALKPASDGGLLDEQPKPIALCVDQAGDLFVLHQGGIVARYDVRSPRAAGVRGPSLRGQELWAADGQGRTIGLDPGTGLISVYDPEGWLVARGGGLKRRGGALEDPRAVAVAHDGSAVYVLDPDLYAVVRYNAANLKEAPLVIGSKGGGNGQFSDPVALALDGANRCYVVDADQCRVQVFDGKGAYQFAFAAKGTAPNQLDEPKLIAVSAAGDAAFVYDDDRLEIKKFALDQAAGTASHVGNGGGKGDAPGQVRKPLAMACDRSGLIHLLDGSREDLQILDFRGGSLVGTGTLKPQSLGVRKLAALALSPDGVVHLAASGQLTVLR